MVQDAPPNPRPLTTANPNSIMLERKWEERLSAHLGLFLCQTRADPLSGPSPGLSDDFREERN